MWLKRIIFCLFRLKLHCFCISIKFELQRQKKRNFTPFGTQNGCENYAKATPFDATKVRIRCRNEDIPTQEQQVCFKVHSKARDGKEEKQAQK